MKTTGKKPKRNAGPLRVGNKSKWLPEAFCAMALVFLATIIWCYFRDRLTASSWKIPAQYNGDAIQILGWIKAAAEGDYVPFWTEQIHRLGAPYQANWNDYPMYEKIITYILGLVARAYGVIWAGNFGMVLAHATSALSFYICCRILKFARVWSFVGALLFAFTYYNTSRRLGHLLLVFSYTLPFAVLSCWLIASSQRLRPGNKFYWICLATAVVMGLSNPYNLNMYLQLLGFALLVQFILGRRNINLRVGILSLALVAAAFIAINLGTLFYEWQHGRNADAVARNYFESELNALKPIEMVMPPPGHHLKIMGDLGGKYEHLVLWKGEMYSAYQGVIGMIALGWIFTEAFLWVLRKKNGLRRIPAYALQVTWIVLYAVVGGVNCVLAFWGIQFFRGSNRYSIFISTLALLFLVSRISHLSRRRGWSPVLNGTLAGFALLVGLFDQLPRQPELSATAALQKASESDRAFGEAMEKVLPPGAMVYELPVIGFPEDKPTLEVMPYDMMIPYLYTRTLRFSFGSVHGRPREDWQWEVEKMPAPEMVAALEKYGFSAIYLDRKGYADKGNGLLKQLGATGRAKFIEDDLHEKVCVFLQPSPAPQFPQTDKRALVNFNSGWAQKEQNPATLRQWSTGNATLSFYNEQWETADFIFECDLGSLSARHVAILVKGEKLWEGQLLPNRLFHVRFAVRGGHGMNQVKFETDEKPVEVKDARYALAFVMQDLHILKAE